MLTKVVVAFAAAAAVLGPCDPSDPLRPPKGQVVGTWGGENAALIADDTSAHVHIGCTYGNISQQIIPDAGGRFDVPGVQNITAHPVDLGVLHPARFVGRIVGGRMSLTVTLTDTTVTLGPVQLAYGKEPRMGPCPICRPGMDGQVSKPR
ncbi:MAG TPA: hypothetical protein VK573_04090 [Gemmatimonadales bacterium]|nr:hypothetical protein [Gemmatimonadales bacterium]